MVKTNKSYLDVMAMLLSVAFLVSLIVTADRSFRGKEYTYLAVRVLNKPKVNLLSTERIETTVLENGVMDLVRKIDCYRIAKLVRDSIYVRNAFCYKTWFGGLHVDVLFKTPIARLQYLQGEDKYVDEQGGLIPLSKNFSCRVPIFQINKKSLQEIKSLHDSKYGSMLFSLIDQITKNLTLNAQIPYSVVQSNGNIELYCQVGSQCIGFGQPKDIQEKLKKLKIFYLKIVSCKGWDFYKKVNLEFDNQIVCE